MNQFKRLLVACLAVVAVACPVTTKVVLRNDSPADIEVLSAYSDAVLSRIAPSSSGTAIYSQDCLRIRTASEILEFETTIPPDSYIDVGTFSVRISATFTPDNDLEITPLDSQAGAHPNITLKRGCAVNPMRTK